MARAVRLTTGRWTNMKEVWPTTAQAKPSAFITVLVDA